MRVAILTISDSVAAGRMNDSSGPALRRECEGRGWFIAFAEVLPDDAANIASRMISICDAGGADVIFTIGGTGLGPRDVTPEVTLSIAQRVVPGLGELMRAEGYRKNPRAVLSRGIVAQCGQSLIINLPGSPAGAVESFRIAAELLPHALEVMRGARHEAVALSGNRSPQREE
jgi:molybdenum cofactor synthesis domain-containing protein